MFQPTLTRHEALQTINLCMQSFNKVKEELPERSSKSAWDANHNKASRAYLAELPILFDPHSFQLYIACIAHGAAIGAIDSRDMGRYCHVAQTAISCWKLANPAALATRKAGGTPTKGNHFEAGQIPIAPIQPSAKVQNLSGDPENARPHPPKGNQWVEAGSPGDNGSCWDLLTQWKGETERGEIYIHENAEPGSAAWESNQVAFRMRALNPKITG